MRIRVGYDICLNFAQPSALHTLMDIETERRKDILAERAFAVAPDVPVTIFTDVFGNTGRRMMLPQGVVNLTYSAEVFDRWNVCRS
jgi:hypothetical protein